MIHDVDESLRALVRRDVLNGAGIEVSFEAPTREWSTRRNAPALNIYLYEIREDLTRREVQFEEQRDDRGFVTARRPPARRFKLSYLITAWTQRPEDEHRLLSAALTCFIAIDAIPAEVLQGDLATQDELVRVTIGLPLAPDRSITDVWTALGGELKPSLDLIVTCPFDTGRRRWVGPPVLEEPRIGLRRIEGEAAAVTFGKSAKGGMRRAGAAGGPAGAGGPGGAGDGAGGGSAAAGKGGARAKAGDPAGAAGGSAGELGGPPDAAAAGPGAEGRQGTGAGREPDERSAPDEPPAIETVQGGKGPGGRRFHIEELPRPPSAGP